MITKPLLTRHSPLGVSAAASLIGTAALLPLTSHDVLSTAGSLDAWDWTLILYLGVVCTLFAYVAWTAALGHLDASRAVAYIYLVPVFAVIVGAAALGEEITAWLLLGGLLVVAGVALAQFGIAAVASPGRSGARPVNWPHGQGIRRGAGGRGGRGRARARRPPRRRASCRRLRRAVWGATADEPEAALHRLGGRGRRRAAVRIRRRRGASRIEEPGRENPYDRPSDPAKRHSAALTDGPDRAPARAMLKAIGFTDDDLARPIVGVATTWIETMPCNFNQRELAQRVKAGIRAAGGTPMEFNTISVSDGVSMGTEGMRASLVSREVIADSIELVARGHLFDGLVCLVGCDKTIPAAVMALARLDIPGLVLYNGSIAPGHVPRPRHHDPGRLRGGRRLRRGARSTPRSCTRSSRPPAPAPARAAASSPPTRCRRRSSSWASARPG